MKIEQTTDYLMFNYFNSNRAVSVNEKLLNSIKSVGLLQPIYVDNKMRILDGQHRLICCVKLQIPVKYIVVDYGEEVLVHLNAVQKKWRAVDYWNYAKDHEHPDVLELIALMEQAGIKDEMLAMNAYTSGSANVQRSLVNYASKSIVNKGHGYRFEVITDLGNHVIDVYKLVNTFSKLRMSYTHVRIYRTLINTNNGIIDIDRLQKVLLNNLSVLQISNPAQFREALKKLYNTNLKKNRLQ